eukprot:Gb_32822 [translate_table: standard]
MTTNNWHIHINKPQILFLCNKSVCSDNIQGGHTKQLLRIIGSFLLEHLCCYRHSRIYRVSDDVDESIRTVLCSSLYQSFDNISIGIK